MNIPLIIMIKDSELKRWFDENITKEKRVDYLEREKIIRKLYDSAYKVISLLEEERQFIKIFVVKIDSQNVFFRDRHLLVMNYIPIKVFDEEDEEVLFVTDERKIVMNLLYIYLYDIKIEKG